MATQNLNTLRLHIPSWSPWQSFWIRGPFPYPPCLQSNKSRDLLFCTSFDRLVQFGREREDCRNPSHGRSLVILAQLAWLCYVLSRNWNSYEVESEISAFINAHACKLRARFIIPTLGLGGHFSIISLC